MKKTILLFTLFAAALVTACAPKKSSTAEAESLSAPNLFSAGSFERDEGALVFATPDYAFIPEAALRGGRGLRLAGTYFQIPQEKLPVLDPSKKYVLSFWGRLAGYDRSLPAPTLTYNNYPSIDLRITTRVWAKYQTTFRPGYTGHNITFRMNIGSGGAVDIDELRIEEAP